MNDKIDVSFDKPVFTNGEMPTSDKLKQVATKFELASDQILRAMGNTFLRNISNIASVLGDASLLSTPTGVVPAKPAIFQSGNKFINRIPVTITTIDAVTYGLSMDSSKYTIDGEDVTFPTEIINIAFASVDNDTGDIYRVYEGTFTPSSTVTEGQDITSLKYVPGGEEASFAVDLANAGTGPGELTFVVIVPNQRIINQLVQALVNIGSMDYPTASGYIADASGTVVIPSSVNTITDEINLIEEKYFYTYWKVVVSTANITNPSVDIGGYVAYAWNTGAWESTSSPDPTTIATFLAGGAQIPSILGTDTDCFLMETTNWQAEAASPNILRARVYVEGVPVMRSSTTQIQVPAAFVASGESGNPTVYIYSGDLSKITTADKITIMIPVAIPFRIMRAVDFMANNMVEMWPGVMKNVIGAEYGSAPFPSTIVDRLNKAEQNVALLASVINNLTTSQVTLTS